MQIWMAINLMLLIVLLVLSIILAIEEYVNLPSYPLRWYKDAVQVVNADECIKHVWFFELLEQIWKYTAWIATISCICWVFALIILWPKQ